MAKKYVCVVPNWHDGIYYKDGDIAVFPDSVKPPVSKQFGDMFKRLGAATEEDLAGSGVEKALEAKLAAVLTANKIGDAVAGAVYLEFGAKTTKEKLSAKEKFVKDREADSSEEAKAAKKTGGK